MLSSEHRSNWLPLHKLSFFLSDYCKDMADTRKLALLPIDNWDNKPIRHKKNKYPVPVDKNSPRMF